MPRSVGLLPAREVMGILIDDVEAEAAAIGVDVELVVVVTAEELSGVECQADGEAQIADSCADGRLVVGLHLRIEMVSVARALGLYLLTREVMSRQQGPLRWRTNDERRVDVALAIAGGEVVVDAL